VSCIEQVFFCCLDATGTVGQMQVKGYQMLDLARVRCAILAPTSLGSEPGLLLGSEISSQPKKGTMR